MSIKKNNGLRCWHIIIKVAYQTSVNLEWIDINGFWFLSVVVITNHAKGNGTFSKSFIRVAWFRPLSESTPESSPVKIWSVKSLPSKKSLDTLPPRQYCMTYFSSGKHWIIDSPQWIFEFHPMSFDITPVVLLILLGVW